MPLALRSSGLFLLAIATASGVENPLPLTAVWDRDLRESIARLRPEAQVVALRTLASPNIMRRMDQLVTSPGGWLRFKTCLPPTSSLPQAAAPAPLPPGTGAAPVPISAVPAYSSRPGATKSLYLDFNGEVVTGTNWNAAYNVDTWNALPYDSDNDITTFSDAEQAVIRAVWIQVALDYAPFNVNVTTVLPTGGQMSHCLITRNQDAQGQDCPAVDAGGVAYLNAFGSPSAMPAWAYYNQVGGSAVNIGLVASHEIGHNMNLNHDGTSLEEYFDGHGTNPWDWGPIMGAPYSRMVTQWSIGEYNDPSNTTEVDLNIIAGKLGLITDDHGGATGTATDLDVTGAVGSPRAINNVTGLISSMSDADLFRFQSPAGAVNVTVEPIDAEGNALDANLEGQNADLQLDVLDSTGAIVSGLSDAPQDQASANVTGSLPTDGIFYIRVRASGNRDVLTDGYSAYASIGRYMLSGTIPAESSTVAFSTSSFAVSEGQSGITYATMSVTRTSTTVADAVMTWTTSDGSATTIDRDYPIASGSLTWPSGTSGTKTFRVPVYGDTRSESDETVVVTITPGAGFVSAPSSANLTIVNDDGLPPAAGSLEIVAYQISANEGTGGVSTADIQVRRRGGTTGAVSVPWTMQAGTATLASDFSAPTSGTLSWSNGDSSTQTVSIPLVTDADPEGDETFTFSLGTASGGAIAPTPKIATITIVDDDNGVRFSTLKVRAIEPSGGSQDVRVPVMRSGGSGATFSVGYRVVASGSAMPGVDFTSIANGTLTWTPSTEQIQEISIPIISDIEPEGIETFTVVLENAVNCSIGSPATTTVEIVDYVQGLVIGNPNGTATTNKAAGGGCGAGTIAGLLVGLGALLMARRRRR